MRLLPLQWCAWAVLMIRLRWCAGASFLGAYSALLIGSVQFAVVVIVVIVVVGVGVGVVSFNFSQ